MLQPLLRAAARLRDGLLAAAGVGTGTGAGADDAHALARQFLERPDVVGMLDGIMLQARGVTVEDLMRRGATPWTAGHVADKFMMPAFRARAPELMDRLEGVLASIFTPAELRAVLEGRKNGARRSAATKAGLVQPRCAAAGKEWGSMVGTDVFEKNHTALEQLGLIETESTQ